MTADDYAEPYRYRDTSFLDGVTAFLPTFVSSPVDLLAELIHWQRF